MKNNIWSNEELDFLKNNYNIMSVNELSQHLDRSKSAIHIHASKLGIHKSKYTFNQDFFECIDEEYKSYWLGFMYADGYVVYNESTCNYESSIELNAKDDNHLRKFNKCIDGNFNITYRDRLRLDTVCHICSIRIYSKKMAKSLISHGCIPNKSFIIKFPNLEKSLIKHFIRGYFDGNGSIYYRKDRKRYGVNITCASLDFLVSIREILYNLQINSYITHFKNEHQLGIVALASVEAFLHYIYDDSNIFLDRKKNKSDNAIASLSSNRQ